MIVAFMILAAALLIVMDALGSGTSPVDWSWVLYVGGAVALFAVLALRARNRSASSDKTDQTEPGQVQINGDEDTGENMDDVRRRIRQRKIDKLS